jgi:phosphatidylglycerophosphatase A
MGHKSNQQLADRVAALPKPINSFPKWIVTGGGVGFLKPAPGSWGTAPPALCYCLFLYYDLPDPCRSIILLAFGLLASILLVVFGKWAAAYFRQPDPGPVILDEYAGFALTAAFIPLPAHVHPHDFLSCFLFTSALYILFRLTDTLKLPPANLLERLPWGWGILCDDLAAGVQANIIARVALRLFF